MFLSKKISNRLMIFNKIAVWGAGGLATSAINNWLDSSKISCVIDGTDMKTGQKLCGLDVCSPKILKEDDIDCVIICSSNLAEVQSQISKMKCKSTVFYIYELFFDPDKQIGELEKLYIDIQATKNSNLFKLFITKPQVLVNVSYRLCRALRPNIMLRPLYWSVWILHYLLCWITSIQLPVNFDAGPGLVFAHPGTIILTGRASVGAFFTIYHCCTVGTTTSGAAPFIGDFVTIYAGSHVLGGCNIGDYSRVGAMSLVLDTSCPPNSTLVGIPAQIVNG